MKVSGLNNFAFAPAPKSQGKTSSKDNESFEDVLGQVKDQARDQVKDQPAKASTVDPDQLPSAPNTPVLENPALGDRLVSPPQELPVVSPFAKPQVMAMKGEDAGVDSLTRRAVWNDFLRKMKDDLGISAEDVLEAFNSLSPEDLAKPPAQTVDKVVMALGLNEQQGLMAKQYFLDLINRTQSKSMGEELASSEKQISLTLMSQREMDRKTIGKSIDSLNQNFFMKGQFERPLTPPAQMEAPLGSQAAKAVPEDSDQAPAVPFMIPSENASAASEAAAPIPSLAPQASASSTSGKEIPKEFTPFTGQATSAQVKAMPPKKADVDAVLSKFTEVQAPAPKVVEAVVQATAFNAQAAAPAVAPIVSESATATAKAGDAAVSAMSSLFMQGSGSNNSQQSDLGADDQEFTSDASFLGAMGGADGHSRVSHGPSEFQQQLSHVDGGPQPMAVPDLVKNAQVMVRDGGGEMKVTLTPDGLGEVAMKVVVKDGKVNVQMITESDEAKRLIERSLGDLKTQLNSHQLQVTDIKIDTASNLGKQLEQQYNDAQRQMAQQTLEQFRQDQQGWRRSFFDVPGAKVYKGQAEAPRDISAPASGSAKRSSGTRRLDLVA